MAVALALGLAAAGGQPSAAQEQAKPAGDASLKKGRDLFDNYACGGCHSLADANATGHVGPALDGNSRLTADFVSDRVTNGQGGMPAFRDQMSADDIAAITAYVMQAKAK
jgi:mono/diheme cytochrome c family protein